MKSTPQHRCAFAFVHVHSNPILIFDYGLFQRAAKVNPTRFGGAFAERDRAGLRARGGAILPVVGVRFLKYAFDKSGEPVVMKH